MKNIKLFYISIMMLFHLSCEQLMLHPNPKTDNLSIFDEYVKICREKYGLFEVKELDFDALVDSIRPNITDDLAQKELFNILGYITLRLREGHTKLEDEINRWYKSYNFYDGYPLAYGVVAKRIYYNEELNSTVKYIGKASYEGWRLNYGRFNEDSTIGFIRVFTFNIELSDAELDTMISYLAGTRGLIVDVRSNFGGYVEQASKLASCFTDKTIHFATNYVKNGPGKDDFASSKVMLKMRCGSLIYTKPIMLLHDRGTFSSGSLFVVMMGQMEHVTTVGQVFGGGTGTVISGYLANGWKYSMSTSILVDAEGNPTDNGLEPDIPMLINPADTINDAVIDRAILEIQNVYE